MVKQIASRYKYCATDTLFFRSITSGALLFAISLVVNYFSGTYATKSASNAVTDIILDNLRIRDVDGIFIYGSLVFLAFVVTLLISDPKRTPFILKSVALFILIRALFISLTHIAPFPGHFIFPPDSFTNHFSFDGDLFFSGHTGLPFFLAILFWDKPILRSVFLLTSLLFAIIVLLGHYHYTIDVFSAFFISYGIADIAKILFKKDHKLFMDNYPKT